MKISLIAVVSINLWQYNLYATIVNLVASAMYVRYLLLRLSAQEAESRKCQKQYDSFHSGILLGLFVELEFYNWMLVVDVPHILNRKYRTTILTLFVLAVRCSHTLEWLQNVD